MEGITVALLISIPIGIILSVLFDQPDKTKPCSTFYWREMIVNMLLFPILLAMFIALLIQHISSKNDDEWLENSRKFDELEDKLILNPLTKIGYLK